MYRHTPSTDLYKVFQNSTDKIGGVAEWTQTNILRFGTYAMFYKAYLLTCGAFFTM